MLGRSSEFFLIFAPGVGDRSAPRASITSMNKIDLGRS